MKNKNYISGALFTILLTQANFAQDIKVVAHRGGVKWGPENTLTTFKIAIDKEVDYIEMDVRQSKDGVFILMHDKDVSRTTNGSGLVKDLNLEELKKMDAGSWYNKAFKGETIPTLKEVLQLIDGRVLPDIDFKEGDPVALLKLLKEEGFLDGRQLTFYSGNQEYLQKVQNLSSTILIRPSIYSTYEDLRLTLNPPIINVSWRRFSLELLQGTKTDEKKIFVNCLGASNRRIAIKKAVKLEPSFIQTDKIDFLIKTLGRIQRQK